MPRLSVRDIRALQKRVRYLEDVLRRTLWTGTLSDHPLIARVTVVSETRNDALTALRTAHLLKHALVATLDGNYLNLYAVPTTKEGI